jgi:myo-inositol-hexaphosphate 3-phosphohydrolase
MTSGVFSLYGASCEITAPGMAKPVSTKPEELAEVKLDAVAYPNPFADQFSVNITSASDEHVSIKVYDLTGRLLESRTLGASELKTVKFGETYPAGVYNIIVAINDQVQTLRIIKR